MLVKKQKANYKTQQVLGSLLSNFIPHFFSPFCTYTKGNNGSNYNCATSKNVTREESCCFSLALVFTQSQHERWIPRILPIVPPACQQTPYITWEFPSSDFSSWSHTPFPIIVSTSSLCCVHCTTIISFPFEIHSYIHPTHINGTRSHWGLDGDFIVHGYNEWIAS